MPYKRGRRKRGRPPGPTCEFVDSTVESGVPGRCLKAARVQVTTNVRNRVLITYRCWEHYVRMEEARRFVREGDGNIIKAEVLDRG